MYVRAPSAAQRPPPSPPFPKTALATVIGPGPTSSDTIATDLSVYARASQHPGTLALFCGSRACLSRVVRLLPSCAVVRLLPSCGVVELRSTWYLRGG
eukprot:4065971-Prymnesium_polylepis.1